MGTRTDKIERIEIVDVDVVYCDRCGIDIPDDSGEPRGLWFEARLHGDTLNYEDVCPRCDGVLVRLFKEAGPVRAAKAPQEPSQPTPAADPTEGTGEAGDGAETGAQDGGE